MCRKLPYSIIMKRQITVRPTGSFYAPSNDEVRQSNDEGANGHQYTTYCNDLWPMELSTKVTDESYHQQVTWNGEKDRNISDFMQTATLENIVLFTLCYLLTLYVIQMCL